MILFNVLLPSYPPCVTGLIHINVRNHFVWGAKLMTLINIISYFDHGALEADLLTLKNRLLFVIEGSSIFLKMYSEVLNQLLKIKQSSKSSICISVLLPLELTLPQRLKNPLKLKNAINQVKSQLESKYDPKIIQPLINELEKISQQVDFKKTKQGLGIFLAPTISKVVDFPFAPKEKSVINNSFEVRDLVYASQYEYNYWVLNLNTKNIRLFSGVSGDLNEILDDIFPIEYQEQYQYPARQTPRISGNYQSEESQIKDERRIQFLRHVNKTTDTYLSKEQIPIVLTGVKDIHGIFTSIFNHQNRIAARVYGDFGSLSAGELANKVWAELQKNLQTERDQKISEIKESMGKRGYLYGIEAVWRIANQGRADLLVVEKDYQVPAFTDYRTGKKYFSLTNTVDLDKKVDAVDDVIELVREKGGEILFVENGELQGYDHIAVKTRY